MASFTPEDASRLDLQLVVHGGVTLFHRWAVFEETRSALVGLGYAMHELDARAVAALRESVTRVLRWKERFGYEPWDGNLDALNDGLGDLAWSAPDFAGVTGVALVLRRFDRLVREDPRVATVLLDIVDDASRTALVVGHRLFAIVQTDDARFEGPVVGRRAVRWNGKEWLTPKRLEAAAKRTVIVGNSGSGKTTLARELATGGVVHLDLDTIVWEPGQVAVRREPAAVRADLDAFVDANEAWVIEGAYGELAAYLEPHATELVFLDPGLETCLAHHRARPFEPHKYASMAKQEEMLAPLEAWVRSYDERDDDWSRKAHERVFDAWKGPKRRVGAKR